MFYFQTHTQVIHSMRTYTTWYSEWYRLVNVTTLLTVGLQQLLLSGDGQWAILGWQNHSQANIVLLRGGSSPDDGQQTHRVGVRSRTETLHTEPGGVAQTWRRREQALPWRWRKWSENRYEEVRFWLTFQNFTLFWYWYCGGKISKLSSTQCSPQVSLQDHWCVYLLANSGKVCVCVCLYIHVLQLWLYFVKYYYSHSV